MTELFMTELYSRVSRIKVKRIRVAHIESKEADDERGAIGDHVEAVGDERERVDREADDELDEEVAEDEEQNDEHARRASERAPTTRAPVRQPLVRVVVRVIPVVVEVVRVRTSRGRCGGSGVESHPRLAALDIGHISGRESESHSVAGECLVAARFGDEQI